MKHPTYLRPVCLLAMVGHVGEGAKECASRMRVAMADEERMRKMVEAFYLSHIRGRARCCGSKMITKYQAPPSIVK